MPRTKQTRKLDSNNAEIEESKLLVKDFERQTRLKMRKYEAEYDMLIKGFVNKIDLALSILPEEIRKTVTLEDLLKCRLEQLEIDTGEKNMTYTNNDCIEKINGPSATLKSKKKSKRQTTVSTDDGYVTESGVQPKTRQHISRIDTSKGTDKRPSTLKRSSSRNTGENVHLRTRSTSASKNNKLVTPAVSRQHNEYNLVTPKVKPNTPLNVLRRPREGEMALSMQGSPLLVSAIVPDRTANINVPLNNGNIISLLPNDGLRLSNIPKLDEETMKQLETLKGHIEKVIGHR